MGDEKLERAEAVLRDYDEQLVRGQPAGDLPMLIDLVAGTIEALQQQPRLTG